MKFPFKFGFGSKSKLSQYEAEVKEHFLRFFRYRESWAEACYSDAESVYPTQKAFDYKVPPENAAFTKAYSLQTSALTDSEVWTKARLLRTYDFLTKALPAGFAKLSEIQMEFTLLNERGTREKENLRSLAEEIFMEHRSRYPEAEDRRDFEAGFALLTYDLINEATLVRRIFKFNPSSEKIKSYIKGGKLHSTFSTYQKFNMNIGKGFAPIVDDLGGKMSVHGSPRLDEAVSYIEHAGK